MPFNLPILPVIPKLTITSVLDILIVAILIYQLLVIIQGRRAAHVVSGIVVVFLFYFLAVLANLESLRSILTTLAPYSVFAVIVMFQSEIRRVLARIGWRRWLGLGSTIQRREAHEEIILAIAQLAQRKVGGLIVLERDVGLRTFIESGVALDSLISRDLLLSIFEPNTAMHDGAAIIQANRIAAAACFLPLTMNPVLFRKLGTRHRAGIGVTEESDCLALIVSEETGRISIAAFGEIELDVTLERLEERVAQHFGRRRTDKRFGDRSPKLSAAAEQVKR